MSRLSGFKYRDVIRKIKVSGFEFYRQAAGIPRLYLRNTYYGAGMGHTAFNMER
jgi:hypothetical protein